VRLSGPRTAAGRSPDGVSFLDRHHGPALHSNLVVDLSPVPSLLPSPFGRHRLIECPPPRTPSAVDHDLESGVSEEHAADVSVEIGPGPRHEDEERDHGRFVSGAPLRERNAAHHVRPFLGWIAQSVNKQSSLGGAGERLLRSTRFMSSGEWWPPRWRGTTRPVRRRPRAMISSRLARRLREERAHQRAKVSSVTLRACGLAPLMLADRERENHLALTLIAIVLVVGHGLTSPSHRDRWTREPLNRRLPQEDTLLATVGKPVRGEDERAHRP